MIKLRVDYFDRDDDQDIPPVAEIRLVKTLEQLPWPRLPVVGESVFIGEDSPEVCEVDFDLDGNVELYFKVFGGHVLAPLSEDAAEDEYEGMTVKVAREQGFVDANE